MKIKNVKKIAVFGCGQMGRQIGLNRFQIGK